MSYATAIASPWSSRRLTPSLIWRAWSRITRRDVAITAWLGLAWYGVHIGTGMVIEWPSPKVDLQAMFIMVADQIRAFSILLGFAVARDWTGDDPTRRAPYMVAVLIFSVAGIVLSVTWLTFMSNLFVHPGRWSKLRPLFMLYMYIDMITICGAVVWVINDRQRARAARAAMDRAEHERLDAERRSIESDLQALQARVEPQFLFNTLAHVRESYAVDHARGERMLDELIAYLRAAMPRMRDTSSTVGQELELARAYLNLVQLRLGEPFQFEVAMHGAVAEVRMPPMMLLPILVCATAADACAKGGPRALTVAAEVQNTAVHVVTTDSAGVLALDAERGTLVAVRERLHALFGASARLVMGNGLDGCTRVALELPVQRIDSRG